MSKYKYYFKKPKSEIVKDILLALARTGVLIIAGNSPYFSLCLIRYLKRPKRDCKKVYDTFYRLQKEGSIQLDRQGHRIRISLTQKGKRKAGRFQIDNLKIHKPKKWDKKWRIVIFDIAQLERMKRDIFREKLRDLKFYALQKSVWVCPYECKDEIELLREFFGLSRTRVRMIVAEYIEDEWKLRRFFKL